MMGVVLLLFLFWVRVAGLLFVLFFGLAPPSLEALVAEFLSPDMLLPFLVVGHRLRLRAGGAGLRARRGFAADAGGPPDANVVAAIVPASRRCMENSAPMVFWAVLIVVFTGPAWCPSSGLVVALPLIGHATWHAYRDLVGALTLSPAAATATSRTWR